MHYCKITAIKYAHKIRHEFATKKLFRPNNSIKITQKKYKKRAKFGLNTALYRYVT